MSYELATNSAITYFSLFWVTASLLVGALYWASKTKGATTRDLVLAEERCTEQLKLQDEMQAKISDLSKEAHESSREVMSYRRMHKQIDSAMARISDKRHKENLGGEMPTGVPFDETVRRPVNEG